MKRDQLSILLEEEYFTEQKDERKKRQSGAEARRSNRTTNTGSVGNSQLAVEKQRRSNSSAGTRSERISQLAGTRSERNSKSAGTRSERISQTTGIITEKNRTSERRQKPTGNRQQTARRSHSHRHPFLHAFQYVFFFATLAVTIFLTARVRSLLIGSETSIFSDFNAVDAFSSFSESTGIAAGSMSGVTIVIDPGHGGDDPGCIVGSVQECDINLAVSLKVAELLEVSGAEVILTRTSDEYLALEDRAAVANDAGADYFISLHCNYYDDSSSISGLECYYYTGATDGGVLADAILEYIERNTQIEVRNAQEQDLSVLRNTTMTAVLIEMGYMSNPQECSRLNTESYQNKLAQAIAEGILYAITEG